MPSVSRAAQLTRWMSQVPFAHVRLAALTIVPLPTIRPHASCLPSSRSSSGLARKTMLMPQWVLEVRPDARKVERDRNPQLGELITRSDAASQQHTRGAEGAGADDHQVGLELDRVPVDERHRAPRPATVQEHPVDERVTHHREVLAGAGVIQIGERGVPTREAVNADRKYAAPSRLERSLRLSSTGIPASGAAPRTARAHGPSSSSRSRRVEIARSARRRYGSIESKSQPGRPHSS
jgi:hypothetical protein